MLVVMKGMSVQVSELVMELVMELVLSGTVSVPVSGPVLGPVLGVGDRCCCYRMVYSSHPESNRQEHVVGRVRSSKLRC